MNHRHLSPKLIHTLEFCGQQPQENKVADHSPRILPVTEDEVVRISPEHATAIVRHPVRKSVVYVPARIELVWIRIELLVVVYGERRRDVRASGNSRSIREGDILHCLPRETR